ncbi:E3 ubiquitin-protein ligase MIB2-like [Centruroides sculpturatus]|uniref:E3 ubiquitin-protein ligase MIB2-like n=1 Tax=Centruroides sculpturatus TaxID=218467 RepID=UPI000C6DAA60|nr:E3 ubiquitin-protein ligase MIB2-like [Centruroides sculpturatus]
MSLNNVTNRKRGDSIADIQESRNFQDHTIVKGKIACRQHLSLEDKIHRTDLDSKIREFHEVIRHNNVEQVRRSLEAGINANAQDIATGKLPLIEATNLGHVEIVKVLLAAHADVNLTNIQGITALHVSVNPKVFNQEIVQLFLERRNANYNIQDKMTESTPIHILCKVCTSGKNINTLTLHSILKEMVPRCDLELKDKLGNTPLHIIAMGKKEDLEAMEIVLLARPNINIKNNLGEIPVATAIDHGNFLSALAMLKYEIDTNVRDRSQYTLLHYAAKKNAGELIKKLLEKGCDPNAQDINGDTALHIAAGRGFVAATFVLLKHPKIDRNIQNFGGYTPLMCAVDSGFLKIVKLLIAAKCDIHVKSPETNKTVLDIAKELFKKRNRRDIYDFLMHIKY